MEIERTASHTQSGSIVQKESGSALDIAIHPLMLINISDHYTRTKVSTDVKNPRVIGALLGTQSGRSVEITNSFELVYTEIDGAIILDTDYLTKKQEQCMRPPPQIKIVVIFFI